MKKLPYKIHCILCEVFLLFYINFNYFLKNIQSEMGEGSQTSEQKNATDKQRGNKLSSDGQKYDAPRSRDRPKKRSKRVSYSYVSCSVHTPIQVELVALATTIKLLIVGAAISSLFGVVVPRLPRSFVLLHPMRYYIHLIAASTFMDNNDNVAKWCSVDIILVGTTWQC